VIAAIIRERLLVLWLQVALLGRLDGDYVVLDGGLVGSCRGGLAIPQSAAAVSRRSREAVGVCVGSGLLLGARLARHALLVVAHGGDGSCGYEGWGDGEQAFLYSDLWITRGTAQRGSGDVWSGASGLRLASWGSAIPANSEYDHQDEVWMGTRDGAALNDRSVRALISLSPDLTALSHGLELLNRVMNGEK